MLLSVILLGAYLLSEYAPSSGVRASVEITWQEFTNLLLETGQVGANGLQSSRVSGRSARD